MDTERSSPQEEPKIGPVLRRARTERGISLEQAEEATKIRAGYLAALEREEFDVLPAVYVRGSLKTYANFLRLDGEALSRELRRRQEPPEDPQDSAPDKRSSGSAPERPRLVPSLAGVSAGAPTGAGNGEAAEGRGTDEDGGRAGGILFPFGASYPYLVSGAFVALVALVAVLALTLPGDARTPVAQVQEPLASEADLTADVLVPLRDKPFRAAGEPIPENVDGDRPERRGEEKEKEGAKKEKDGDPEPAKRDEPSKRDEPVAEATQDPAAGPAPREASAAPGSASATAEPDPFQEPREEIAQVSSGSASSTAAASAPSLATASAPAPAPAPAASAAPASAPLSAASAAPPPATADGGGPASARPGVDAPVARPDRAEMADGVAEEIIAEVNAGLPAPARGYGPEAPEQETPRDLPYDAPLDTPLP